MNASVRTVWLSFLLIAGKAGAFPAHAQSAAAMSGDYECTYGCRLTDAAPSIAINGSDAACMNELGGLFRGHLLSDRSLVCFNKVGRLSEDGTIIRWADGVIWRRLPARAR
jgi:hypothetical protein